jgi:SM-20-related protein
MTTELLNKIADELAENSFSITDNFISQSEVEALSQSLKLLYNNGKMKKAGIGAQANFQIKNEVRGDFISWIDKQDTNETTIHFLTKIEQLKDFLNSSCYLGLKDYEAHFAYYPSGTGYQRHLDQFKQSDSRQISFICYLNVGWKPSDGGNLYIYLPKENSKETREEKIMAERIIDIAPIAGRLVCFRSHLLEHEVTTAYKDRLSITGWLHNRPLGLGFL